MPATTVAPSPAVRRRYTGKGRADRWRPVFATFTGDLLGDGKDLFPSDEFRPAKAGDRLFTTLTPPRPGSLLLERGSLRLLLAPPETISLVVRGNLRFPPESGVVAVSGSEWRSCSASAAFSRMRFSISSSSRRRETTSLGLRSPERPLKLPPWMTIRWISDFSLQKQIKFGCEKFEQNSLEHTLEIPVFYSLRQIRCSTCGTATVNRYSKWVCTKTAHWEHPRKIRAFSKCTQRKYAYDPRIFQVYGYLQF